MDVMDRTTALIGILRAGSSADRMTAAAELAALGPAALPPLLSALDDPDPPRLRMWAAYTLGMIGGYRSGSGVDGGARGRRSRRRKMGGSRPPPDPGRGRRLRLPVLLNFLPPP
ncbi:HEAT repeat domain-containing protein, partial [Methanoculleus chikugoensis]|uniref:HEAT repeat domain-containing protein n=1 Tax=Methanoculleus chikugoensis TaxID=118126 RepID=UPI001FB2437E